MSDAVVATVTPGPGLVRQRGKFYYDTVVFQVEDKLHRIPRIHLTKYSQVFKDMFELPPTPSSEAGEGGIKQVVIEGTTDEHPIVLPGCTNEEFESLLEVLLTPGHLAPLELDTNRWIAALKLSTMWDMPLIRALSIKSLSSLPEPLRALQKVQLGLQFKIREWVIEGCTALILPSLAPPASSADLDSVASPSSAATSEPLSLSVLASHLGWETAARIAWISRSAALSLLHSPTSQLHSTVFNSPQARRGKTALIPPQIWRCGNCTLSGNFQSGYCFGCRNHTSVVSVDLGDVVVVGSGGNGNGEEVGDADLQGIVEGLVRDTFEDELGQMSASED